MLPSTWQRGLSITAARDWMVDDSSDGGKRSGVQVVNVGYALPSSRYGGLEWFEAFPFGGPWGAIDVQWPSSAPTMGTRGICDIAIWGCISSGSHSFGRG